MVRRLAVALTLVAVTAAGCGAPARQAMTTSAPTTATTASTTTTTAEPATTTTAPPPTTTTTVAKTTLPPTTTRPVSALQRTIDQFAAGQKVPFSVVAVDFATGVRATRLSTRQVLSASLYKLFVARELLRRIHAGTLDRDDAAGDTKHRTVGDCLTAMIVVSDNDCGEAGMNMVGKGALDAGLARDGYVATRLATPQRTSAADVALFLERARNGTLLPGAPGGREASAELYDLLRRQQVNDRLPLGLPAGTPIAHKTGDRIGWAHDAGIITTPKGEVLLAVLSGQWASPCCDADHPGPAERVAFGAIAELGRRVYAVVTA